MREGGIDAQLPLCKIHREPNLTVDPTVPTLSSCLHFLLARLPL